MNLRFQEQELHKLRVYPCAEELDRVTWVQLDLLRLGAEAKVVQGVDEDVCVQDGLVTAAGQA